MRQQLINDIVEWDTVNWHKAIQFWEKKVDFENPKLKCLELGGRSGGLSLWLALKGNKVVCSDLYNPKSKAEEKHEKYGKLNIDYQEIDVLNIPYENSFDIIAFKSILGRVSKGDNDQLRKEAIEEIYKALKPGGKLLFAENLTGSKMHQFFRKKFTKWGALWNYFPLNQTEDLFSQFHKVDYKTVGFFGTFGRNEKQRRILGKIDTILNPILNSHVQYVIFGVAEK